MALPAGMSDLAATAGLQGDVAQKLRVDALKKTLSGGKTKEAKLREACQGFESVFISKLFSQMRATVPKDGLLHGKYEEQYYSMFDKAMSDKMAADGGIGLADMMYRQLKGQIAAKGAGKAEAGDILPANRPVAAHGGSFGPGADRIPQSGSGAPAAPRGIQADHFSPAMAAALARPGVPSLAPSHTPAAGSAVDVEGASAQAAVPLTAPAVGEVSSEYGWRNDPFKGSKAWHAGLDIAAPAGDPVAACWDGTVTYAGTKGGYGNVVEVTHAGGWKSVYGHLRSASVKAGDAVTAGEKIAEVGSSGRSTGPHLHFELRRDGETVDPKAMLAASGLLEGTT